jgi:hypothetical protein
LPTDDEKDVSRPAFELARHALLGRTVYWFDLRGGRTVIFDRNRLRRYLPVSGRVKKELSI